MSNARTIADYANDDGISGNKIDGGTISNSALATTVTMTANHPAVKTALNASGNAPIAACRAFVTFDSYNDLNPASIKSGVAHNVSSVTRVSEGRYKVFFTHDAPNANYVVAGTHSFLTQYGNVMSVCTGTKDVSYCEILTIYHYSGYGVFDNDEVSVAFFY
jgi:hypothetical protein